MISALLLLMLMAVSSAQACDISFDCNSGKATINGKSYGMICGRQTARGIDGGTIGSLIRANGRWRPGLVRPGTPMITTAPQLCGDCFIHVSDTSRRFSNGCLGTTAAAFTILKGCGGSKFVITRR
jgi:hypothetical protein